MEQESIKYNKIRDRKGFFLSLLFKRLGFISLPQEVNWTLMINRKEASKARGKDFCFSKSLTAHCKKQKPCVFPAFEAL
ncbi:MAG: hypothetical protein RBS53_07835 [Bacteroidales bacterium]|nr:hypothetical protein [Bacteroidales bacterium]NLM93026.1 hypothetical protein [Bacteroidales bacterium]